MQGLDVSRPLDWQTFEQALPSGWRELAAKYRLIGHRKLPPHLGAKVKDISDIVRLVLYQVATNSGLESATSAFAAVGLLTISFVALHKWMKKIGPYLQELVARMVSEEHAVFAPELWAGYEVIVTDATCVERPGAKGTTARVHYALRLTDLRPVEEHITDEKGGETLRRFHPEPGQLWLGDRGYANARSVAHATGCGADVLIRHNRWSLPLFDIKGKLLDVLEKLGRLNKPGRVREWKAWVHPDKGKPIARWGRKASGPVMWSAGLPEVDLRSSQGSPGGLVVFRRRWRWRHGLRTTQQRSRDFDPKKPPGTMPLIS